MARSSEALIGVWDGYVWVGRSTDSVGNAMQLAQTLVTDSVYFPLVLNLLCLIPKNGQHGKIPMQPCAINQIRKYLKGNKYHLKPGLHAIALFYPPVHESPSVRPGQAVRVGGEMQGKQMKRVTQRKSENKENDNRTRKRERKKDDRKNGRGTVLKRTRGL